MYASRNKRKVVAAAFALPNGCMSAERVRARAAIFLVPFLVVGSDIVYKSMRKKSQLANVLLVVKVAVLVTRCKKKKLGE